MSRTQLRGIVVAANSLEEAQDLYSAVATGQNVKALHDEDDTFVVLSSANSDITLLNPLTGADDLVEGDGLVEQMEFLSSDSGEHANTHYTICVAGCNAHIIADDVEMLQHCPACASAISDLDADAIAAHTAQAGGEDGECQDCATNGQESAIASGATLEEAVAAYRNLINGETEPTMVQSSDSLIAVAGSAAFDAYTGDVAAVVDVEAPALLQSLSSSADQVEAHHFICASSVCPTPHVVSSDEMPVFCPACASGLLEPEDEEATAGSDDDEDEGLDDDEDYDEEDDEEEEEDDEDEDEEDEEDEEEEDDLSLSLSSNRNRTAKRVRLKSQAPDVVAAVASADVPDTEFVAASYMSIAASGVGAGEKFNVAYAGSLQGDNVWFATINRVPVAMALASETKHPEIFDTEVFGRAVLAQASEHGIPAALAQMGFTEIKPEIEVGEHVSHEIRSQVAEQVQEVRAAAEQDKSELAERLRSAMAIAATGITRGFFPDQSNPIAQALISSLASVGMDNAAALVNQAFATHSDNYHKALLAQASTIMSYDLTVQNQLATAVAGSNVATASVDQPIGRPVTQKAPDRVAAVAHSQPETDYAARLSQALSGLGAIRR